MPPALVDPAKQLQDMQKDYPQIITGTIKFFDTKTSFKSTITTDSGTEYILQPAQPESVYESFGAKNGGKVQVNAKMAGNGNIDWVLMKPI